MIVFIYLRKCDIFKENSNCKTEETAMEPIRVIRYPCTCLEGECGCCSGNLLSNFNINLQNRACVNMTYYSEDFEFHVRFIFNDVVFFQRKMSGMIHFILYYF